MKQFSRVKPFALVCFTLYSCLAVSCKTAEFRSTPGNRKLSAPNEEIVAEKKADKAPSQEKNPEQAQDPVPARVSAPDPIVEAALNPSLTDLSVPPKDVSETFIQQSAKNTADILIVIDDSNSMREEQRNLSSKMNALLKSLQNIDWQIGVVTTSAVKSGADYRCDLQLIRASDSDADEKFATAIQAGIKGDGNEQGILQAVVGLRCPDRPWVREKSTLAVLIVSDEDNCSNGMGCDKSPALSETYLIDYVEKDLGRMIGINAGFYGIYSPPGDECPDAPAPAHIYQRLIDYRAKDQKNFGNICGNDMDYQNILEKISARIADLLKKTFDLKEVPIQGSVRVEGKKTDGKAITPSDFTVMGKVLGFNVGSEPMKGSTITVKYQVPGTL